MVNNKVNVNVIDGLQPILDRIVDYDNITNCITEIPQDIKLEIESTADQYPELILKAESKVYVSTNGTFGPITIQSDIKGGGDLWTGGHNRELFVVYVPSTNRLQTLPVQYCFSQNTAPTSFLVDLYAGWFDTSTNTVKYTIDGGSNWIICSLPLCLGRPGVEYVGWNGYVDQVFNGFGYIGSTAFILPGVKFLVPNGRNEDGSLKNIEMVEDGVHVRTITWNNSGGQKLFIGKYDLNTGSTIQYISTGNLSQYYQQETEPSMERYIIWYKPSENKTYRCDQDSSGNLIWKDIFPCYIGEWFTSATSPYQITSFTSKLPFRAVDQNDFNKLDEEAVKTSGNQTIRDTKVFANQVEFMGEGKVWSTSRNSGARDNRYNCKFYQYGLADNVLPTATVFGGVHCWDKNNFEYGTIFSSMSPTGVVQTNLWVHTPKGTAATMGIQQDANGNTSTYAPTPATTDNSTKIATTAFFRNNMQVVTALPSSPTTGVFYFVKE